MVARDRACTLPTTRAIVDQVYHRKPRANSARLVTVCNGSACWGPRASASQSRTRNSRSDIKLAKTAGKYQSA